MGTELELKYAVDDLQLLDCILTDREILNVLQERYRCIEMRTTYFDTQERQLAARKWTLRLRQEDEESIVTFKTAAVGLERGEWEAHCELLEQALPQLAAQGAPQELAGISPEELIPVCGAQFKRIAGLLKFADGSSCELAADIGELLNGGRRLPICELELERKEGSEQAMLALGQALQERFGIRPEPRSTFVRAAALGEDA